ncbi:MAG: hypothetical protein IJ141_05705 [Lachnospiraceae bacterium]|nr:hypothetical protein [Lachnospiraceae bacterium]
MKQYINKTRKFCTKLFIITFIITLIVVPLLTYGIWHPIIYNRFFHQHSYYYANPVQRISPAAMLVYDEGGTRFRVDNKNTMLFEKSVDYPIHLAEISDNGMVGVITSEDKYSKLNIYNKSGYVIYSYCSFEGTIENISFNEESTGADITICVKKGYEILYYLVGLDFCSTEPVFVSEYLVNT